MLQQFAWNLFEETGSPRAYILYKELCRRYGKIQDQNYEFAGDKEIYANGKEIYTDLNNKEENDDDEGICQNIWCGY